MAGSWLRLGRAHSLRVVCLPMFDIVLSFFFLFFFFFWGHFRFQVLVLGLFDSDACRRLKIGRGTACM